jgi:hypothetical protein
MPVNKVYRPVSSQFRDGGKANLSHVQQQELCSPASCVCVGLNVVQFSPLWLH